MKQLAGNGEKARQTEAKQGDNQCNPEHDTGGLGTSASQSENAGVVKDTTSNSASQRRNSDRHIETQRGKIFGGILRQLIAETRDQLADYRSKIERLENVLLQLQALSEQLELGTGEGKEDESPEEEFSEEKVQGRSEEE